MEGRGERSEERGVRREKCLEGGGKREEGRDELLSESEKMN